MIDHSGPCPYGPPALKKSWNCRTADRSERPEAPARQRNAPSGAKGVLAEAPRGAGRSWSKNLFDSLSEKLSGILGGLTRRGALSEQDVDAALREARRALLQPDGARDVARSFIEQVKKRAVGVDVIKSVTPGQMVVKIVHDEL